MTAFTVVYTWRIVVVLAGHLLVVLLLKLRLELRSVAPDTQSSRRRRLLDTMGRYFVVGLSTLASTFVYFRIEQPSLKKGKHSTAFIQVLFLLLMFAENSALLWLGLAGLSREQFHESQIIAAGVISAVSFIIGTMCHYIYYAKWGHPWAMINGPNLDRKNFTVTYNKDGDKVTKLLLLQPSSSAAVYRGAVLYDL